MGANNYYNVVIIGGGFYGCNIAIYLKNYFKRVLILEKEKLLLTRSSANNQARVHKGYHYPRSILTAYSSRLNFTKFVKDYQNCIVSNFNNYYAISKKFSKVNTRQFKNFCQRVALPLTSTELSIEKLFNFNLIEAVFKTEEYVFDIEKLTTNIKEQLEQKDIKVQLNAEVTNVKQKPGIGNNSLLEVTYIQEDNQESSIVSDYVFNCSYSALNTILARSQLPTIPLKHELTEMALIKVPEPLNQVGITVVCGPFFSLMPFPSRHLHTLSHVRYTPHCYWLDRPNLTYPTPEIYQQRQYQSNYHYMIQDAARYLPILKDCSYLESLWEIKTVLPQSELNDSRPILFQQNLKLPNLISILGGKIDNIYDILDELKKFLV
ncbi:FAD-dependent oxidoreductase [Gloeocapsa sp. PCC 73106]|uniref:FAD-dependent oxidoreductase n=1 Tax=Gloeocapsa sp. PCC 73106 TaxID=102232 RepID=UPI0002ABFDC4|nr:FAD-dependent oxidoreductase [Gloeocapsa sp. PCC 73106]ELR97350.1 FAD dependent oxidoreductase [Gloeocapsa sp. PCC 73106]